METLLDDNFYQALHAHAGFGDLDPWPRSQESLKIITESYIFLSFECESTGAFAPCFYPITPTTRRHHCQQNCEPVTTDVC